ncbi:MAG: HdeD family acid-resistance protein [Rhizobiales bacterium]|nr:HdeD family acid-resistance protein [Hyphomicrobiales bacterium]
MTMSIEAAAEVLREAMRESVRRHWLWYLLQGGLMVLGGVLALIYPIIASLAVVALLGWVLIVSGIAQGLTLLGARNMPTFWLQAVSVALSSIVGVLFLSNPEDGLSTVTFVLIVYFVVEGISKVIFSLTIRPFRNWVWVLGSGILSVVIAFILYASMTAVSVWLLGILLGAQLIAEGAALGYLAWDVRKAVNPAAPLVPPVA